MSLRYTNNPVGHPVSFRQLNNSLAEKLLYPAFIIYITLVFWGAFHHESWADEAQAWLLVRDNNLSELFRILPSEGHPPLWYLIIYPFVKSGMPYESIKFLAAIITIASTYIFLFKTRLNILLKILLPFSYIFMYQYAVFARSYCLILFFTACLISLYPSRFSKPWLYALCIIALFNTHVLVFTFCSGLVLLYITEAVQEKHINKQTVACIILMCIGGGYLLPYLGTNEMVSFLQTKVYDTDKRFYNTITGAVMQGNIIASIVIILLYILFTIPKYKPLLLLIAGLSGVFYILTFRYTGNSKHAGIILLLIIAVCGIAVHYKENTRLFKKHIAEWPAYIVSVVICLQSATTYQGYAKDLLNDYSASKEAAAFIKEHHLDSNIIVAYWAGSAAALLPYLDADMRFYHAECRRHGTYYVYDSCYMKANWYYPVDYAVKVAHEEFKGELDRVIFLLHAPVQQRSMQYLDLLYKPDDEVIEWTEQFHIYKFKPGVK